MPMPTQTQIEAASTLELLSTFNRIVDELKKTTRMGPNETFEKFIAALGTP